MDAKELRDWAAAVDISEAMPMTANLPKEAPPGLLFEDEGSDGVRRKWLAVEVVGGNSGGRWAYWAPWKDRFNRPGVGPHPNYRVIADAIFNGDAHHFVGMLGIPYVKLPQTTSPGWVLMEPRVTAPPMIRVIEEKPKERYERSREIYDVDTGETTKLPPTSGR